MYRIKESWLIYLEKNISDKPYTYHAFRKRLLSGISLEELINTKERIKRNATYKKYNGIAKKYKANYKEGWFSYSSFRYYYKVVGISLEILKKSMPSKKGKTYKEEWKEYKKLTPFSPYTLQSYINLRVSGKTFKEIVGLDKNKKSKAGGRPPLVNERVQKSIAGAYFYGAHSQYLANEYKIKIHNVNIYYNKRKHLYN